MGEITDGQPVFAGDNELDQLYIIQKILGPLSTDQFETFEQNPRFAGLTFPEIKQPETLQKKYMGKLSKRAMQFMQSLLQLESYHRPDTNKMLAHAYFDEYMMINRQNSNSEGSAKQPRTNTTTTLRSRRSEDSIDAQEAIGANGMPAIQVSSRNRSENQGWHSIVDCGFYDIFE